jgi:hypothetical protein|tara:strand:- start:20 stop:217 length:198 start_codon:yes stop_codon:yes gene_type:complete
MKNIAIITLAFLLVSACSVANPKLSFGKKCMVKGDSVSYSYIWLYDKKNGLPASEKQCEALPKKD